MRTSRSIRRVWAVVAASAAALAACSGDDSAAPPTTSSVATSAPAVGASDDDTLTIGVLLPLTDQGSEIGTVMSDAVDLAVAEIRQAGGLGDTGNGVRAVETVVIDESTLKDDLPVSVEEIFNQPVDAIVGPASSNLAARLLPITVRAGVITCSPTANAMSLDDFPDSGPMFVRTIPSDELQARALARQLDGTGSPVALVHVDDAYGGPFLDAVREELNRNAVPVLGVIAFDPQDSDYADDARAILDTRAPTIGIIGDPLAGPRLLQALSEAIDPASPVEVLMNDAMRVPQTSGVYRRLDASVLDMMRGVSPRSTIGDETIAARFPDDGQFFAANAYDCVNLLALAASQSGSSTGAGMASQIVAVSTGGTSCTDFASCSAALAAERNIDYDGPTGVLDIGRDGDPTVGLFDVYGFDRESGLDITFSQVPIVVSVD